MQFIRFISFEILNFLSIFVPLLLGVAFMTLIERKVMGLMQKRRGPNVVGFAGLLQPIADGVKLLLKEPVIPHKADKLLFLIAPVMTFALSLMSWSIIPLTKNSILTNLDTGILFLLGISSLSVYGIIISGWASNSKYAFFGALRSAAQMISYEVSLSLAILPVVLITNSLNLGEIVHMQIETIWFLIPLFPSAIIFFVSCLAETNRAPFDLPEAEGELVAGFNVEYSAMSFALFFLAEYANILLMSTIFVLFFMGGWGLPFFNIENIFLQLTLFTVKFSCVLYAFVWVRASFPRFRFDQLLYLGWKTFLPLTMGYFLYVFFCVMGCHIGIML